MQRLSNAAWSILAVLPVALASPVLSQEWQQFRGPHGDGRIATSEPLAPQDLSLRWKVPLGSGYSGVSVSAGIAVTMDTDGTRDRLVAFDAGTGELRWALDVGPMHLGHDGSVDGPISTPAIADGRVFALSAEGQFFAASLDSGEVLWTRDFGPVVEDVSPYYGFGSSPLPYDDMVLIEAGGDHGALVAMRAVDGKVVWRSGEGRVDNQSPVVLVQDGQRQVVYGTDDELTGVDPASGSPLWQWRHDGSGNAFGSPTTSPLPLPGGLIHLTATNDEGAMLRVPSELKAAGSTQPKPLPEAEFIWRNKALTRTYSPPTHWDGVLYGFTARLMTAWDVDTGELLWRSRDPGDGFSIAVDGSLVTVTKDGSLHLSVANRQGWQELAAIEVFDELVWTPPSYADGSVWVRSIGGLARVEVVRESAEMTRLDESGDPGLPIEIRSLRDQVASGLDSATVVDQWLSDRQTPIIDGERVLFLWRGEATDVGISGDFLGMRREQALTRLTGTDLWWVEVQIPEPVQISYLFHVDFVPRVDPLNPRQEGSSIVGRDTNWLRPDEPPLMVSAFAMPGWQSAESESSDRDPGESGTVESFEVRVGLDSAGEEAIAHTRVWLPADYSVQTELPVVYVLGSDFSALDPARGDWQATLERESARTAGRRFGPLIAVFVAFPEPPGEGALSRLVQTVDERYSTVKGRQGRAIVSASWLALDALIGGFRHRDLFAAVGVQSFLGFDEEIGWVAEAVGEERQSSEFPMRIYVEWGVLDIRSPSEGWDMRVFNRRLVEQFEQRGYEPVGGPVADSSDWKSWRHRTAQMLGSLLPAR